MKITGLSWNENIGAETVLLPQVIPVTVLVQLVSVTAGLTLPLPVKVTVLADELPLRSNVPVWVIALSMVMVRAAVRGVVAHCRLYSVPK